VSLSADNAQAARDVLVRIGDVAAVEIDAQDQRVTAFPRAGKAIFGAVVEALKANGIQVREIALEQGRLDEVFRQITTPSKVAA
jgi:ABC-2 type transport system ATP-binding protein